VTRDSRITPLPRRFLLHVVNGCASSPSRMPFDLNHPPGAARRPGAREL